MTGSATTILKALCVNALIAAGLCAGVLNRTWLTFKPGAAGEVIWNFNRPGEFDFACLIAGHYQAGMVGKIKVLRRS